MRVLQVEETAGQVVVFVNAHSYGDGCGGDYEHVFVGKCGIREFAAGRNSPTLLTRQMTVFYWVISFSCMLAVILLTFSPSSW